MGIPAVEDSLGRPAIESVILIERRLLVRECFAAGLERASGYNVISFASPETYLERADRTKVGLIVLCTSGDLNDAEASRQISLLSAEDLPVVLIADREDASQIVKALEAGARGFIPSTLSLAVVVEALRFVRAGGTFVPQSSLPASRRSFPKTQPQRSLLGTECSPRVKPPWLTLCSRVKPTRSSPTNSTCVRTR